jgi:hypothetical protein
MGAAVRVELALKPPPAAGVEPKVWGAQRRLSLRDAKSALAPYGASPERIASPGFGEQA